MSFHKKESRGVRREGKRGEGKEGKEIETERQGYMHACMLPWYPVVVVTTMATSLVPSLNPTTMPNVIVMPLYTSASGKNFKKKGFASVSPYLNSL